MESSLTFRTSISPRGMVSSLPPWTLSTIRWSFSSTGSPVKTRPSLVMTVRAWYDAPMTRPRVKRRWTKLVEVASTVGGDVRSGLRLFAIDLVALARTLLKMAGLDRVAGGSMRRTSSSQRSTRRVADRASCGSCPYFATSCLSSSSPPSSSRRTWFWLSALGGNLLFADCRQQRLRPRAALRQQFNRLRLRPGVEFSIRRQHRRGNSFVIEVTEPPRSRPPGTSTRPPTAESPPPCRASLVMRTLTRARSAARRNASSAFGRATTCRAHTAFSSRHDAASNNA